MNVHYSQFFLRIILKAMPMLKVTANTHNLIVKTSLKYLVYLRINKVFRKILGLRALLKKYQIIIHHYKDRFILV